jgi:hypothetical protein
LNNQQERAIFISFRSQGLSYLSISQLIKTVTGIVIPSGTIKSWGHEFSGVKDAEKLREITMKILRERSKEVYNGPTEDIAKAIILCHQEVNEDAESDVERLQLAFPDYQGSFTLDIVKIRFYFGFITFLIFQRVYEKSEEIKSEFKSRLENEKKSKIEWDELRIKQRVERGMLSIIHYLYSFSNCLSNNRQEL